MWWTDTQLTQIVIDDFNQVDDGDDAAVAAAIDDCLLFFFHAVHLNRH